MKPLASRSLRAVIFFVLLVTCVIINAQTDCPQLAQITSDGVYAMGLLSGASVYVAVVDTSAGAFSDAQITQIDDAMTGIANTSDVDFDVDSYSSMPPLTAGTASNPINIVETATQEQMVSYGCSGDSACTLLTGVDDNGHTTKSYTFVLAPVPSSYFEQLMTHEFGHADFGLMDCSECSNTIMNPVITGSSPTAPTACDDKFVNEEQCGCST